MNSPAPSIEQSRPNLGPGIWRLSFWLAMGMIAALAVRHQESATTLSLKEFMLLRIQIKNFLIGAGLFGITVGIAYWARVGRHRKRASHGAILPALVTTAVTALAAPVLDLEAVDGPFLGTLFAVQLLGHLLTEFMAGPYHGSRAALHVVILGTSPRAVALSKEVKSDPAAHYRLLGFVGKHWSVQPTLGDTGIRVISDYKNFGAYLKENVVDLVLFCLPPDEVDVETTELLDQCWEQGVGVVLDAQAIYPSARAPRIGACFGGHGVSLTPDVPLGSSWWVKRIGDVLISVGALILLSVPFLAIAAAIRLTSPGPVFFRQVRVGFKKRRFLMYKFRTMVQNAEALLPDLESRNEVDGAAFKLREDPRITPIGRFLRRSSIDELPQLINVLMGDMSLVGPRPLPLRDYANFSDLRHCRRQSVSPGLTCLSQINGRSAMTYDEWMQADLEYIDRWSLWLDLKILLRTIPVVLSQRGAY